MPTGLRITPEKELLIGLIVSDEFIKQLAPTLQQKYLKATSSRHIMNWCLEYFDKYGEAPKELIQDIYVQYKDKLPEEDSEIIAKTLSHINKLHQKNEKINTEYMVDKAVQYIKGRRLDLLRESIEDELDLGNIEKAEALVTSFTAVNRIERKTTNLWDDNQIVDKIFDNEHKEVFKMPGVAGELMGYFTRSNLYAYAGVAKRGKTRWLAQTATTAAMQGCNTLLIELEMDDEEISDILLNNFVRKPKYEKELTLPYFTEENDIAYRVVHGEAKTHKEYEKWRKKGKMRCAPLHRIVANPSEATIPDLEAEIAKLEFYEGFSPDVIIIDYADIIAGKGHDARDRVNNIWLALKTWAKKYHCAVITATHMNGEALKKDAEAWNVGEDKRKLNHVAGMYILNQTEEEKKQGIMRIKATATRFGSYTELDEAMVLYDYGSGRTYIDSRWKADVENEDGG